MSIFGLFFLIILVALLWPLIKVAFRIWLLRRQVQQAYRQTTGRQQYRSSSSSGKHGQQGHRRSKRIPDDIGEYIEFEELTVVPDPPHPPVEFVRQEQISDAEWEEI